MEPAIIPDARHLPAPTTDVTAATPRKSRAGKALP